MIPESKNVAFIIGAGFSQPFDLPVMNRFLDVARHRLFAMRNDDRVQRLVAAYESLLEFRAKCRGSLWAINRNWDNIEGLMLRPTLAGCPVPQVPNVSAKTSVGAFGTLIANFRASPESEAVSKK